MKFIYFLILLLFIGCSKNSENKPTLGKVVKHQLGISHSYNFGKLQTDIADTTHTYYDSLGNEVESYHKEFTGIYKYYQKRKYKYGPNGRIDELIIYDTNGQILSKYINHYNERGQLIGEDKYSKETDNSSDYSFEHVDYIYRDTLKIKERSNKKPKKILHFYNNKKQLIKTDYYYGSELGWTYEYQYDEFGNRVFWGMKDNGKFQNIRTYKFDKKGREIEEISLGEDKRQAFRSAIKYDENNRIIEYQEFNELDEPHHITKYHYSFW